jgi:predicted NBD/HSP70 family sugar kinase
MSSSCETALVEAGGSGIRVAVASPDGPASVRRVMFAAAGDRPSNDSVVDLIAATAADVVGASPSRVVVAWPGPVGPGGAALATPTVGGGVEPFDVAAALSSRLDGADVHVLNDLTAAGLALAADGLRDFAVITVGSGVGHKVFVGGTPVVGPGGRGGELGHVVVDRGPAAAACDCGGRGHLGAVASGRAIVDAVVGRWDGGDTRPGHRDDRGEEVSAAFRAGDPTVRRIVAERARVLGWGLAMLHVGVGVETFVLVGGFAFAAGDAFRTEVARGAADSCWNLDFDWDAAVRVGEPSEAPGLAGAWLAARDQGWV